MPSAKESECEYAKSATGMWHAVVSFKKEYVSLCGSPIVPPVVQEKPIPTLCFRCQQRMKRK